MTRLQARQRVLVNVRAFLELELKNADIDGGTWLTYSKAPACDSFSEKDCITMRRAARDVVHELRNLEAKCAAQIYKAGADSVES